MEIETVDELISSNQDDEVFDILNEITSLINKYISDNRENMSLIQLKLSLLLKTIQELFYPLKTNLTPNIKIKKVNLLKTQHNPQVLDTKTIYNIQKKMNEKKFFSIYLNSNTSGSLCDQNNSNSENIYEVIRLKRKLKEEHEKYILREIGYLERISMIQNQLKKNEKEINSLKFPYIFNNNSNNSINSSGRASQFLFSKRNNNFSCDNIFNNTDKKSNRNNLDFSYFEKNINLNDFQDHKQHNSIQKLHYKYDVGNSYLKHDFKNIQKTFLKNSRIIRSLKECYSPSSCMKETETNSKNNKSQ